MARRTVDTALLQGLVQGSVNQEIQKGTPRTTDKNFPVFATPVNSDILVYIPMTNVVTDENGPDMKVLPSHIHDGKLGKAFTSIRCISGLSGNPAFDSLGYDGTCPACEATRETWELYRLKLDAEAKRIGIDPQNDPADTLKPAREKILGEMDLKGAEEYVTFPIVIIPTKAKFTPADDALENLEVVYVHWRKKRYSEAILAALDTMMTNPGHPAGLFWLWKFSYDTQGKQANARDSAKNAKYTAITDAAAVNLFAKFIPVAEEKAKEFTLLKAAEVVVATQFMFKEDMDAEVGKVMAKTRQLLQLSEMGTQPQLTTGAPAGQLGAGNPLASYGVTPEQPTGAPVGAVATGAPINLGQANPVKFG
jgi:hypothetical protein